ncbi:MAG: signal peptidase I [Candidatus Hydrogenedentes bacterium]|nr:signal peptidase I [Candidatus Hydrogenedentota bacterium]MBI3118094.1 signal peptidase I [Candidatus Hydrogenedentota bacterium]
MKDAVERPGNPPERRRLWFLSDRRIGNYVLLGLVIIAGYFFAFRGMRFFAVPSQSMEPALLPGDQLVTLHESHYQRGDIVVLREENGEYLVKRIAGLPGDSILITEGALFINESYASEPYIKEPMSYTAAPSAPVPPGHVYLLGDNRNNSDDSSANGTNYPLSSVVGKVIFRYYPYDRWGAVASYPLRTVDELETELGTATAHRLE